MRIVHSGWFLQEGFRKLGCEVTPLRLDQTRTLNEQIEGLSVVPDLVCIELFGKTPLPRNMADCAYPLAAYCVDSPLNEYWLVPLSKLFDLVYVDQLSSVGKFRKSGVQARWLPLCVSEADFRPAMDKEHLITFVGRVTPQRAKRANLIRHLSSRFPVKILDNISVPRMLDVFASSRIVLNENFFSGLNLRFFQALASGSLLLTERGGYGVRRHFQEGRHYVGYSPGEILEKIARIEQSYDEFAPVAAHAQEECRARHTSESRALTILEDIDRRGAQRSGLPPDQKRLHEAQAKYCHAVRFGGRFDESVTAIKECADAPGETMAQALCLLGSIHLRSDSIDAGVACLEKCAATPTLHGLNATLKLMLLVARDRRVLHYLPNLLAMLKALKFASQHYLAYINSIINDEDTYYNICMLGHEVLFDAGGNFDLGFSKPYMECFPDYSMEYAVLAFREKKTPESLGAILKCTRKAGIAPEALGYIKEAILVGVASDEQIAQSAALALEYYDFAYANTTLLALKTSL